MCCVSSKAKKPSVPLTLSTSKLFEAQQNYIPSMGNAELLQSKCELGALQQSGLENPTYSLQDASLVSEVRGSSRDAKWKELEQSCRKLEESNYLITEVDLTCIGESNQVLYEFTFEDASTCDWHSVTTDDENCDDELEAFEVSASSLLPSRSMPDPQENECGGQEVDKKDVAGRQPMSHKSARGNILAKLLMIMKVKPRTTAVVLQQQVPYA
eukprot:TRINITY_DN2273_c0_g1_i4.p1 TRINITY_DN2273_c0_g1~~TRINITY_DN2273_c0_g1_i4.p1  ORF type:complete len:213 (-),score=20.01 TRINITY_DN2273_c0_g1_i4:252-890(-)